MRNQSLPASPSPVRFLRTLPALAALLAAAGCDPVGPDEPPPFGLASIESAWVDLHQYEGSVHVWFRAELTPAGGDCPSLASDLVATVNGQPIQLSLYDDFHTFTFSCQIHELEGGATLPATDGPVRIVMKQGARTAVMEIASAAWPAIGPVSLSRTAVPVGESFRVDVGVSGGDPTTELQLGRASNWLASICPREMPKCVPGEGWAGLTLANFTERQAGIGFDVEVADVIAPGQRLLTLKSFGGTTFVTITACSGFPTCFGTNNSDETTVFGPFDFEVLD